MLIAVSTYDYKLIKHQFAKTIIKLTFQNSCFENLEHIGLAFSTVDVCRLYLVANFPIHF